MPDKKWNEIHRKPLEDKGSKPLDLGEHVNEDVRFLGVVPVNAGKDQVEDARETRQFPIWLGQVVVKGDIRKMTDEHLGFLAELCETRLKPLLDEAVEKFRADYLGDLSKTNIEVRS